MEEAILIWEKIDVFEGRFDLSEFLGVLIQYLLDHSEVVFTGTKGGESPNTGGPFACLSEIMDPVLEAFANSANIHAVLLNVYTSRLSNSPIYRVSKPQLY